MAITVPTGLTVVTDALKKAGVTGKGRQPDAYDSQGALDDLNDMIASWNVQRWIIWEVIDLGYTSQGVNPITIGPGGNINISERPVNLKAGYVKLLPQSGSGLPVNQPLEIIPSREQYSRLALPGLVSFPLYLFLDTSYPLGKILVYPIANANLYEIHVIVQNPITYVDFNTDLSILPKYYIPAFKFNLAKIVRQGYGKKEDAALNKLAADYLDVVVNANLQIPELIMPKILITQSSGYNILNDQFGNG